MDYGCGCRRSIEFSWLADSARLSLLTRMRWRHALEGGAAPDPPSFGVGWPI
jgi:hypothetical protein